MNHPPITPEECYAALVNALESLPGVAQWEKQRFGSPGLTLHGKTFAMLVKGRLAIKLPKARVDALVAEGAGERFALGRKRMKEWVTLEPGSQGGWLHFAREAMEFVASGR